MTYEEEIGQLRKKINRLNEEIIEKLEQRIEVSIKIGNVKRKYNKPIVDRTREKAVFKQIRVLAEKYNINAEDVEKVFREIVTLCTNAQLKT